MPAGWLCKHWSRGERCGGDNFPNREGCTMCGADKDKGDAEKRPARKGGDTDKAKGAAGSLPVVLPWPTTPLWPCTHCQYEYNWACRIECRQ